MILIHNSIPNINNLNKQYSEILDATGFYFTNNIEGIKDNKFPIFIKTLKPQYISHEISHYAVMPRKLLKSHLNCFLSGRHKNLDYFNTVIKPCQKMPKKYVLKRDKVYDLDFKFTKEEIFFPFVLTMNESGVCAYDYELLITFNKGLSDWKSNGWTGESDYKQLWLFGAKPILGLFEPTINYIFNFKTFSIDCFYLNKKINSFNLENNYDKLFFYKFMAWCYPILLNIFRNDFIKIYPTIKTWIESK